MQDKNEKLINLVYRIFKCFCKMFAYSTFRIRVRGLENVPKEGAFLLLSNHQSFLDPVLIGVPIYRRVHFVARDSLYKGKLAKKILQCCMTIPIKRGQADTAAIKHILRTLKHGHGVGLFPEATRTNDGTIVDVKPGFGLLVRKSKAIVIPTVIEGAYESWPRHRNFFLPGDIDISYGEPITPEDTKDMNDETFASYLTERLRKMQNEIRQSIGKQPFDYQNLKTEKPNTLLKEQA